jgi:hypothetical protein
MPNTIYDTEKKVCDRCGFDHKKSSLRKQKGLWLASDCYDNIDKIKNVNLKWLSPRDNSNTTTVPPEATPEVFVVSAANGIDVLSNSNELYDRRDGRHISIYMKIVSDGGPISISADPQIIGGMLEGDLLTLQGTSDTDTVTIVDDFGVRTHGGQNGTGLSFTLGDGDTMSFVYTQIDAGWGASPWGTDWGHGSQTFIPVWRETSRFKGGF